MGASQPVLAVITDEIAPSLDAVLAFAAVEKLTHLEIRQIDGANFLSLSPQTLRVAARRIADAGLKVSALTTPLLKWPAPGQPFVLRGDQFGFDPQSKPFSAHYEAACEAAHIFGTRYLRIFSYLTHEGFTLGELDGDMAVLLRLAEAHDVVLIMENEPVCNVRSIAGLIAVKERWPSPRLKVLLDIGNVYGAGGTVSEAEIASIMPHVPYMHIKDYDARTKRHAVLGEGSVPFAKLLPLCQKYGLGDMTWSLEPHVPGAARASLAALRQLAATAT
jgi:sugar phosphate isomerase/epimerase